MILPKITIENSEKYIPKCEKTQQIDFKPKTIKTGPLSREQHKNLSQNNKKFLKNISTQGFNYLK